MDKKKLQIGVVNIMPDLAEYHHEIQSYFSTVVTDVSLCWIKLEEKSYSDKYASLIETHYQYYSDVQANTKLDALVITGAPVELLEFEDVGYWNELKQIIEHSMQLGRCLFGICWGALAIGNILGVGKRSINEKLSGVYQLDQVSGEASGFRDLPTQMCMPISSRAFFIPQDIQALVARQELEILMQLREDMPTLIKSANDQVLLCLGHPEYGSQRLTNEWKRESRENPNTRLPEGINVEEPDDFWRHDSGILLKSWIGSIKNKRRSGGSVFHRVEALPEENVG